MILQLTHSNLRQWEMIYGDSNPHFDTVLFKIMFYHYDRAYTISSIIVLAL